MKENKYDDPTFFGKYSRMPRSKEGLAAAGEWHVLRRMLPPFEGKRVLDLGCGFGWHCRYAVEQGLPPWWASTCPKGCWPRPGP